MTNASGRHAEAVKSILSFLIEYDDVLITTHVKPDGDSISSVLCLACLLDHLGKRYQIVLDDAVPSKFDFLPGIESIHRLNGFTIPFSPRAVAVLDAAGLDRIGRVAEIIPAGAGIVNIDHHPGNGSFGAFNLVDETESSTVEIVCELLKESRMVFSPDLAFLVYTGVMCDTGRFLFPNTTDRSLELCAEMVRLGADPVRIALHLYYQKNPDTIRAMGRALSTLELHFDGRVSSIVLDNVYCQGGEIVDTEGFIDYPLMIEGTEVIFFMLEQEPGLFRVSFRSKHQVDVNAVAQTFGGGGHTRASGCRIKGTASEVKQNILKVIESHL
jgi:bifunctional oligoribonuclease and PAP phosphatase NrnA